MPFFISQAKDHVGQTVTIQGHLSYRVTEPRKIAELLDYSTGPDGRHLTDDPELLAQRLIQRAQILARHEINDLDLTQTLGKSADLERTILASLGQDESIAMMGVRVLSVSILFIKPTPEMAKALEAEAREALQQAADQAIYDRRNASVEQERRIRENELQTQIAIVEKKREIEERRMAMNIAIEDQRRALVESKVQNDRKVADAESYALKARLDPLREIDWRQLMAISASSTDPGVYVAMAFRELAENAHKIGELNMTPELLSSLTRGRSARHESNEENP